MRRRGRHRGDVIEKAEMLSTEGLAKVSVATIPVRSGWKDDLEFNDKVMYLLTLHLLLALLCRTSCSRSFNGLLLGYLSKSDFLTLVPSFRI